MRWLARAFVLVACVTAFAIGAVPWLIYWGGLSNIDGRPVYSGAAPLTSEEEASILRTLRIPSVSSIRPVSPWDYELALLSRDDKKLNREFGTLASWQIARSYNATHLKNRRVICSVLSGMALTVWVSRNWSPREILSEASQLERRARASNYRLERP